MTEPDPRPELLAREHRELDELFGRFLAAASNGSLAAAARAMEDFDRELRRHTAFEEEHFYPQAATKLAAPASAEDDRARLFRELRLEHVQVREVSGMILRLLSEKADLDGARRLAGNLARRWDAHTSREEKEALGLI